jgi:hypothetical protein
LAACLDVAWCEVRVCRPLQRRGPATQVLRGKQACQADICWRASLRKELCQISPALSSLDVSVRPARNAAFPSCTRISSAGAEITNAGITAGLAQLVSRWFANQGVMYEHRPDPSARASGQAVSAGRLMEAGPRLEPLEQCNAACRPPLPRTGRSNCSGGRAAAGRRTARWDSEPAGPDGRRRRLPLQQGAPPECLDQTSWEVRDGGSVRDTAPRRRQADDSRSLERADNGREAEQGEIAKHRILVQEHGRARREAGAWGSGSR